jgi:hypothetical protein
MTIAVNMQTVLTQLLEHHGIAVTEPDAFLWLALPAHTERLIIERIDERYLSVALARAESFGYFTLAPQLFFSTDATGWTPIHLDGAEAVDDLTQFAEVWAQRLLDEGWLEQGERLPEPPWLVNQEALWASVFDDEPDNPATGVGEEDLCNDVPF